MKYLMYGLFFVFGVPFAVLAFFCAFAVHGWNVGALVFTKLWGQES